ncbi:MAG: hypothetical protein K2X72_08920 [Reyranella sp.]|nr:hypothetical protein [Reyranella sp.]
MLGARAARSWETINTEFFYGMARGEVDLANDWTAFAAYASPTIARAGGARSAAP